MFVLLWFEILSGKSSDNPDNVAVVAIDIATNLPVSYFEKTSKGDLASMAIYTKASFLTDDSVFNFPVLLQKQCKPKNDK